MKMKLNRDFVLATVSGLSIEFKEGVPTHVPPRAVKEATAAGALVCEVDPQVEAEALAEMDREQLALDARKPTISDAIKLMLKRDQRGDFTAGGRPNLKVLFQITGLTIDATELDPIWAEVKKDIE